MYEKIKITLPKAGAELLKKDCVDFKVVKENGEPNMNSFVNSLVVNFYEEFSAAEENLHDEVKKAIAVVPDYYRDSVFRDIVKLFAKRSVAEEDKRESVAFSFKPTKSSEKAVIYIEHALLVDESLSSFYRRMFSAYSQKTKNEREKIIFKDNYTILQKAVAKGLQVCIALQSGDVIPDASVYAVAAGKDELFNYVLIYANKQNITVRLASVRSVSILPEKSDIPPKNAEMFARQVSAAAQYPIYNSDKEPIKVQLTDKGKKLFDKIYLYRPTPVSIEGDIYTFDCSANQLLYYFERFGDSALILSPKRLGIFMRNYYYYALKKYRSIYKFENK